VVCLDLESFFPHINHDRVYEALRAHLGCSLEIANLLTKLTTFQKRLPQGSPASTFLANLVLIEVIDALRSIAQDRRLALTCFIDDLTFSGEGAEHAIGEILAVLASQRLKIARSKLNIAHAYQERTVTGTGVSRRLSIPRNKLHAARDFLHSLTMSRTITAAELARAKGLAQQARQVNESQAAYLLRRLNRLPPIGDDEEPPKKRARTRDCHSFNRAH
jgi:hypothetical protein